MSSKVLANAQDFLKGMSYMQASIQATWHLNFLSVGIGSNHTTRGLLHGGNTTSALCTEARRGLQFKGGVTQDVKG